MLNVGRDEIADTLEEKRGVVGVVLEERRGRLVMW